MHILVDGFVFLIEYLTLPRMVSITIAFFLSGAIAQFISQRSIVKYFGPSAHKTLAYLFASVSGGILVVCSCSVLPMFAVIRKKGAGIGPAITFLFAGPAINVLAILLTFTLIGVDIGIVRTIAAGVLSIIIGLLMFLFFRKTEQQSLNEGIFQVEEPESRKLWQNALFFFTLIALYISGIRNYISSIIFLIGLLVQLKLYFSKNDIKCWLKETYRLALRIVPLSFVGIFLAGMVEESMSPEYIVQFVGNPSYISNLMASSFGAFMYFATLTEIPIVQSFMSLGMLPGPAVAMLLAGPSVSLPTMIVIYRVLGAKKASTYILLVVLLCAFVGFMSGVFFFH
ncbi:MAG TPA: permease [Caldisericia bacterium]|nr:permease [Caldisericia bacterium]